jgi:Rieske 2Fe-2S family protein
MSALGDVSSLVPSAPVPADGLARALLPFGRSTMLPRASYTSPDVLAWELRAFVAGSWACVGRSSATSRCC